MKQSELRFKPIGAIGAVRALMPSHQNHLIPPLRKPWGLGLKRVESKGEKKKKERERKRNDEKEREIPELIKKEGSIKK